MSGYRMIFRLAARNIFRNVRRTWLTVFLIACGLAALIFADAYIRGSMATMIRISTETLLGEAQIHLPGYRDAQDVDLYISDVNKLTGQLNQIKEISAYSPRIISGAMISSSENVAAGMLYGIDAEKESSVGKLKDVMIAGDYLTGKSNQIILGQELVDILELRIGDRVVVTASQANGGELSQNLFRLSGIFRFKDRALDSGLAFINLKQAQKLVNISGVHEVAIKFTELEYAEDKSLSLWDTLNTTEFETLSWFELVPQLNGIIAMVEYSTLIVATIMYILVSLGVINTMFMSIYERHYEFGILLAIGTRAKILFVQVLIEGIYIALISIVIGNFIGGLLSYWGVTNGLNFLEDMEFSGITMNEPIFLIIDPFAVLNLSLSLLVITVLACVYPAIHGARLSPSTAMRKTR